MIDGAAAGTSREIVAAIPQNGLAAALRDLVHLGVPPRRIGLLARAEVFASTLAALFEPVASDTDAPGPTALFLVRPGAPDWARRLAAPLDLGLDIAATPLAGSGGMITGLLYAAGMAGASFDHRLVDLLSERLAPHVAAIDPGTDIRALFVRLGAGEGLIAVESAFPPEDPDGPVTPATIETVLRAAGAAMVAEIRSGFSPSPESSP